MELQQFSFYVINFVLTSKALSQETNTIMKNQLLEFLNNQQNELFSLHRSLHIFKTTQMQLKKSHIAQLRIKLERVVRQSYCYNITIIIYQVSLSVLQMKNSFQKNRTPSNNKQPTKRAKQLSEEIDKTSKIFNPTNFITQNKHLDVEKLKKRIQEAKKRHQKQKINKELSENKSKSELQDFKVAQTRRRQNIYLNQKSYGPSTHYFKSFMTFYHGKNSGVTHWKDKNNGVQVTSKADRRKIKSQGAYGYTQKIQGHKKSHSRNTSEAQEELLLPKCRFNGSPNNNYRKSESRTRNSKSTIEKQKQKRRRLATDIGQYKYRSNAENSNTSSFSRITEIQNYHIWNRKSEAENPKSIQNSHVNHSKVNNSKKTHRNLQLSQFSVELKTSRKILITEHNKLKSFEMKILLLWDLYEELCSLTEEIGKNGFIGEQTILKYVGNITKQKLQFVYELCDYFLNYRMQRTIKLSRVLEYFSIFQLCLNGIEKKKLRQAEIINFLGYSSSSVVFLIKLFFMCHETPLIISKSVQEIRANINGFETKSYGSQLTNYRDVLRRMQHNNQIIQMLKIRCGRKHGKYCEQFITQTIKNAQKSNIPFYEIANNIFEFMAFYLHFENLAYKLPLLSYPPTPFLFLKYSRSIVIQPWGVLAYRKNDKLVVRAQTSYFLSKILNTSFVVREESAQNTIIQSPHSDSTNFVNLHNIEKTMENSKDNEATQKFNLIFWTQLMPKQADFLAQIFPHGENIYWLYRYHCQHEYTPVQPKKTGSKSRIQQNKSQGENYNCVKNLEHLGGIADNSIIIDNNQQSFKYNPDNGVNLKWKGEKKDSKLSRLWDLINKVALASESNRTTLKEEMRAVKNEIDELQNEGKIKKFRRNKFLDQII